MIGRSPTLTRYFSSAWQEVSGPVRRALPWAALAAVLAAVVTGGAVAVVESAQRDQYIASAQFTVLERPKQIKAVSRSRGLIAEQVMRSLRSGRAQEIAAGAAPDAKFSAKWVTGPAFGDISFTVTSPDPKVATAAAKAVHDQAGFLGLHLVRPGQPRPTVDLGDVKPAAPIEATAAKTVGLGVVLAAFTGFMLTLLFAVPMRRPLKP